MAKLNTNMLLFNAGGVLIAAIVIGYNVMQLFDRKTVAVCSARYLKSVSLALDDGGSPLTPIELQARSGAGELGVLENAKVVRAEGAPTPLALEISLNALQIDDHQREEGFTGIRMTWTPSMIAAPSEACLTYSMWVPDNFDFGVAGTLPGIYGGQRFVHAPQAFTDAERGFQTRVVWGADGEGGATGNFPAGIDGIGGTLGGGFTLPRGRWVKLEQEVVLNRPGEADGIYRLWADGKLVAEMSDVVWRRKDEIRIAGVVADVRLGGGKATGPVRLSVPVLAWN